MKQVIDTDIAIMGSGVAGMGAAYKAANAGGLNISVFEKYPAQGGAVSNAPMSFGSTPDTPEAQKAAFEILSDFSNYSANMALLSKVIKYSSELPRIIIEELGIKAPIVIKRKPEEYGTQRGYTMGFPNSMDICDIYFLEGRGKGHAMAMALLRLRFQLEKKGVRFYFRTPIRKILRNEDGRVTGAIAEDNEGNEIEIRCKALIVASGGLGGNLNLMKELGVVKSKYEDCYRDGMQTMLHFPQSCQDGDGQLAVWEIGGKKSDVVISAGGHVPNPGIMVGENTPWLEANQINLLGDQPYLRVTERGQRFINEEMANNHVCLTTAIMQNGQNMAWYLLIDEDTVRHMEDGVEDGYVYFIFPGAKIEHLREQVDAVIAQGNQHVCHFDTIHEVCEYMGIDEKGLRKTLEKYNRACETGVDEEFHTPAKYLRPVREESGQIYCFRMLVSGYDTLGGLEIDENANVLDEDNQIIEGLYAGGDMVIGSIYGNPPSNACGNVYGSMTTGLIAGDCAAAYVKGED